MAMKEGSIVPVNLRCGCAQVSVTMVRGTQRVRCPKCQKDTEVRIEINKQGDVSRLETTWA